MGVGVLLLDRARPWSNKYDFLVLCWALTHLGGPGPVCGPGPVWACARLGLGAFGPVAPFGPGPIWSQACLCPGPFGPFGSVPFPFRGQFQESYALPIFMPVTMPGSIPIPMLGAFESP